MVAVGMGQHDPGDGLAYSGRRLQDSLWENDIPASISVMPSLSSTR